MGQRPNSRDIRQDGRHLERSIPVTITFADGREVTIEVNRRQHTSLTANARRMNGNNEGLISATDDRVVVDLRVFDAHNPVHGKLAEILRSIFGPEMFPISGHTLTLVPRIGQGEERRVIIEPSILYGVIRPIARMVPDAVTRVKGGSLIYIFNIESRLQKIAGLREIYEDLKKALG